VGDDRCVCPGAVGGDQGPPTGLEEEDGLLLSASLRLQRQNATAV
jgi:hypothetical protein